MLLLPNFCFPFSPFEVQPNHLGVRFKCSVSTPELLNNYWLTQSESRSYHLFHFSVLFIQRLEAFWVSSKHCSRRRNFIGSLLWYLSSICINVACRYSPCGYKSFIYFLSLCPYSFFIFCSSKGFNINYLYVEVGIYFILSHLLC